MDEMSQRKRSRVDSAESIEFDSFNSSKTKRIRDDILSLLDESDPVPPPSHDLDSVIRSFEEEIVSGSSAPAPNPAAFIDLTSDNLPEFGEFDGGELTRVSSESSGIGELWEFKDELASYDPFEFGLDYEREFSSADVGNEYVTLDGIFDYSDVGFGSDFTWRSETLPAL